MDRKNKDHHDQCHKINHDKKIQYWQTPDSRALLPLLRTRKAQEPTQRSTNGGMRAKYK